MKKQHLIISIIILVLLGGLFIFYVNLKNTYPMSEQGGGSIFGSLFPFNFDDGSLDIISGDNDLLDDPDNRAVPVLRKVSESPVSGGYAYITNSGVKIRYVERSTGHVYETSANGFDTVRISNTTIPGVQEVLWISEHEFILRYLLDEKIETFYVKLKDSKAEQSLNGSFIDSWDRASFDKFSGNLLSLAESESGSILVLGDAERKLESIILTSPIKSLVPLQTNTSVYVQTATNSNVEGGLYEVKSGTLRKIFNDIPGLLVNPQPDGNYLIGNSSGPNTLSFFGFDLKNKTFFQLGPETIVSKCAWIPKEDFVFCGTSFSTTATQFDGWLLGEYSFNDVIWGINIKDQSGTVFVDPQEEVGEEIDVWQPMIDETGSYMIFINKKDLSLWSLRLKDKPINTPEE